MTNSELHGYYNLGGEPAREGLLRIDEAINARLPGVPLGIPEIVAVPDPVRPIREGVRTHIVPSFHYNDPSRLKLSMFMVRGKASKVDFVWNRLAYKMPNSNNQSHRDPIITSGKVGIDKHLHDNYPLGVVTFKQLDYEYEGVDRTGRPTGRIFLTIDKENPINQIFFEAQEFCVKAIRSISGNVHVQPEDSVRIGLVDVRNATHDQIQSAIDDVSIELQDKPIEAQVGVFALKNKLA